MRGTNRLGATRTAPKKLRDWTDDPAVGVVDLFREKKEHVSKGIQDFIRKETKTDYGAGRGGS